MNPYVSSNLDVVETALTLVLLLLSCCGIIFVGYSAEEGAASTVLAWHVDLLTWLAFVPMVVGTALSAALLANEAFEAVCGWYLDRVNFLGIDQRAVFHVGCVVKHRFRGEGVVQDVHRTDNTDGLQLDAMRSDACACVRACVCV